MAPVTPRAAQHPGDGDGGDSGLVAGGDGTKAVPERQVALQRRRSEMRELDVPAPPVAAVHQCHAFGGEAVGEEPGLHRAVAEDTRLVLDAPGKKVCPGAPVDQGERQLQRVHVTNLLATFEEGHVEVGNGSRPDLALLDQATHLFPGFLYRHPFAVGPVELVEVDPFDAQAPEGVLALLADRVRTQAPEGLTEYIRVRPTQAAFGENVRSLDGWYACDRTPDDFLGMAPAVNRCRVDPVHTERDRMAQRADGRGVILCAPVVLPLAAPNRPATGPDHADVVTRPTEPSRR